MASGKTEELNAFSNMMRWRVSETVPKKDRDRSLRGKDRIRARRRQNKINKALDLLANHTI